MKRITISLFLAFFVFANCIYSMEIDTTGQKIIFEDEDFIIFSEDDRNYAEAIQYIKNEYRSLQTLFGRKLGKQIKIYIYKDHESAARKIFSEDKDCMYTGFPDHINFKIYVTSFYDIFKTKEHYLKVPIHEIVHLFYSPKEIWLREGLATYLAGMYQIKKDSSIPMKLTDMVFYGDSDEQTKAAYNNSGILVKYIIEELCKGSFDRFIKFTKDPNNYTIIGIASEKDLFSGLKIYIANATT